MSNKKHTSPPENKSISISGDVRDSNVFIGDNNTFIQKFFNIFKSDAETLEQRNRRILLGHVENAWIKGVLDASLHGAALLDLGIKPDPEAVTQYPWTIKKESTDETLPAGTSMLEIFDSIGMGRSLLILGAPGSGKTTMLLELARGLIARAREDVTQPIPMVFNLASWTEKLTLADWLAQELNNLYSVPRKTAPDWVKGNKLLLLLDGLDEVRQDSRAKCVEAINAFRKEHGLTSLAVCSRSQDYADLNAKLSFEGAIEVQPLTQGQIAEFFNRFGEEMAGITQALEKDSELREMAETPLFLSIMMMAYRDNQVVEILVSGDEKARRKHLFDNYIQRMFERQHARRISRSRQNLLHWLSWSANQMVLRNHTIYSMENVSSSIAEFFKKRKEFGGGPFSIVSTFIFGVIGLLINTVILPRRDDTFALGVAFIVGLAAFGGLLAIGYEVGRTMYEEGFPDSDSQAWLKRKIDNISLINKISEKFNLVMSYRFSERTEMVNILSWDFRQGLRGFFIGLIFGQSFTIGAFLLSFIEEKPITSNLFLFFGFLLSLILGLITFIFNGLKYKSFTETVYPGQRISLSLKNSFFAFVTITPILTIGLYLAFTSFFSILYGFDFIISYGNKFVLLSALYSGLTCGLVFWWNYGAAAVVRHYTFRFILARNNLLPWRLVPFLDHCVDLIFLRRVGGGYIFVHRLLMEHFAEMYEGS